MRNSLKLFAFLDILSIALLSRQVVGIFTNWSQIPHETLSQLKILIVLLVFISLFGSAYFLFFAKRAGAIIYYVQFPLRFIVWIFSFGFLTLLAQYSSSETVFDWLFRLVVLLEFLRLYFTIKIHRELW
ncbi:hypothetical protein GS399_03015 [Pedobacter sp. HMF7647]|uniref:Uncharacterized protein n=1 Tax=Hufsiella arboris TaxID=2695275 RepID=A0A7K1Y796_9SPHI|nr:hypothetical protein [Hufsiella arboris]MXV49928.1 hypothetical protein [Hufsiella arboris]